LWRERLEIHLGAGELSATRFAGPGRRRALAQGAVPLQGAGVAAVAEALAALLQSLPGGAADAWVTLSQAHVRLALVPEAAALRGREEHQAAALHTLVATYGEAARGWAVSACRAGPDRLLAAGIEQPWLEQIGSTLAAAGVRLRGLQPLFAWAFNQCLPALRGQAWFVAAEPGRAAVCFVQHGGLRALRSHRSARPLADELPRWLEQGRLLDGVDDVLGAEAAPVVLAGHGLPQAAWPWPVRCIELERGEGLPA
jgi:hypothetical protein